jgi:DNA-binding MarR family transcriptional regulator
MSEQRDELGREIVRELQRYFAEARLVAHSFADLHGLHATDLHALIEVMNAEGRGNPITAGGLGQALGLSSGATTAVIDRLERLGHLNRVRTQSDRRRVFLHYAADGMALAREFFGPLGERSDAVMADFTDAELAIAHRFLVGMGDAIQEHRREVQQSSNQPNGHAAGDGGGAQPDVRQGSAGR